ncbi:Ger(x)C family spore germination protein [Bacillus sp. PS06]|uniref:Ger(x)C family spore germination protein n=1 Tax=Bacillus sp. PS06 TaxID=2764176 RepID=UPI00178614DA|nr:Ger(x)C family spore germination protein [Bacillus sp. PS06]MBD8071486.1 Ger(x)C family spore germination protein [Bacillus sp. PS06]
MKNLIIFICVFILLVFTYTFGRVDKEILDDVNVASAIGIDKVEGKTIKGTAIIPVFQADKSIGNENFVEESTLAKEVINKLQNKSADPMVTGGIKVALYSEEIAREGINDYADALQRDASIGSKVFLGIVDGQTEDLLKETLGNRGTGYYLRTLIEHNMEIRDLPDMNLHLYMFRNNAMGMDPYLPYLRKTGNKAQIIGLAIFKGDKMVDVIDPVNLFFFKALVQNFSEGTHTLHLKDANEDASIMRIVSTRHINVEERNGQPQVTFNIYLQGILSEYSGEKTTPAVVEEIVSGLEKEIIDRSEKMLKKFQELNTDPVGLGYIAKRSKLRFDEEQWKNVYQHIDIKVTSKVDLIETGVIE